MREIDVLHLGRPKVICCFEVDGVIVDPGPEVSHRAVLEGVSAPPRAILLTHIHLDHAGATGRLCEAWPDAEVWVHERGAGHVADPSKLVASATRIYGDDMARLWGAIVPVDPARLRILQGGETIDGFRVAYTPGHASHHVSYLHEASATVFAGDVAGVRIDDALLPPTPPPDIDLEAWHASLAVLQEWAPERLAVTHFGLHDGAAAHLERMHGLLDEWGELARVSDDATYAQAIRDWVAANSDDADAFLQAMPPETLWPGLDRYWSKRGAAR